MARTRSLVRQRAERELDAELRAFLETAVDEKLRSGMSREQATRAARLELGLVSVDSVKDRVRDVGWESTVESVARDVQYAVRTLRNAPGFASVAVLTLALGIGANTAIFGLIDALMLRQLPVRDPDQLVVLTRIQGGQSGEHFSYPQVNYLAEQDDLFAGLCGFAADTFHIGPSDALETAAGAWVTGEYYRTMGITPIIGRLLGPDDDRPGAPPAAVITDAYWSRKFARGPDVIGQTLLIEGVPVSIVGVTPAGFSGAIVGDASRHHVGDRRGTAGAARTGLEGQPGRPVAQGVGAGARGAVARWARGWSGRSLVALSAVNAQSELASGRSEPRTELHAWLPSWRDRIEPAPQ